MNNIYESLLFRFADSLLETQIKEANPAFNGGFLCPCCKNIHGRSIDTIYGLAICYKLSKNKKYLNALISLFEYSNNLLCTDGGLYNDLQTEWRFTTTFHQIAIIETLNSCKNLLPFDLVEKMENHAKSHAKWLYFNLNEFSKANINYCTTNALALLLSGLYFHNDDYLKQSEHLVGYALKHISQNNLFYGECQPHDFISNHGCRGIDIGYNLEESLPALAKYAFISKNTYIFDLVLKLGLGHLPFILPDGAIDNSFGCRNYKWTYYGSRTCDGILPLCFILGQKDKRFIEAAYRNLTLIDECSKSGLLYGGVQYEEHNELPCLHHTFEHINSVAFVLDNFAEEISKKPNLILPSENIFDDYYPEMDSYRISNSRYILDVTNNDINIPYSGHLTGAAITLLYDKKRNKPLLLGSVGDYQLTESTNMQVTLKRKEHKPLDAHIEKEQGDVVYKSTYDTNVSIKYNNKHFDFSCFLFDRYGKSIKTDRFDFTYDLKDDGLYISISSISSFNFIIPLVDGDINVSTGKIDSIREIFFLTPGFIAKEYMIKSENNKIKVKVS